MASLIGAGKAHMMTTPSKQKKAPVAAFDPSAATQRPVQNNENAGESGWMPPTMQAKPAARMGGPTRKMHAPGMRGRK